MTRVLVDTSVLIDAEREGGSLDALIADDDEPAIAAITLAELGVGVDLGRGAVRKRRAKFLEAIAASLPIVDYDAAVADAHRQLLVAVRRTGRPRGAHDLIIAATAAASGRILVTHDRLGFVDLAGVEVRDLSGDDGGGGARARRG